MAIPEPMLSTRAATWPAQGDWMMEPKWDGFRLLVAIDQHGRMRAWSRRGDEPGRSSRLAAGAARRGTPRDRVRRRARRAQLPRRPSRPGLRSGMPSHAPGRRRGGEQAPPRCLRSARARRRRPPIAALGQAHGAPAGDFPRRRPAPAWSRRNRPAAPPMTSLSRSGLRARCSSGPGRRIAPAARPLGASTRPATAPPPRCAPLRPGRDGHTYAICELDGRRVTTLGSPRLAALIGHRGRARVLAGRCRRLAARGQDQRGSPQGWRLRKPPRAHLDGAHRYPRALSPPRRQLSLEGRNCPAR